MLFRTLAHADIPNGCRHQDSFVAFQRTQHDLDWELTSILPPPNKLNPSTNLLRQRVSGSSCTIGDQPFPEAFRNDVLHLLPYQLIAAVSELFLRLYIQKLDLSILIHN